MEFQDAQTVVLLHYWARIWHRQAGGYTASDTSLLLMRADALVRRLIDEHPELDCFLPTQKDSHEQR